MLFTRSVWRVAIFQSLFQLATVLFCRSSLSSSLSLSLLLLFLSISVSSLVFPSYLVLYSLLFFQSSQCTFFFLLNSISPYPIVCCLSRYFKTISFSIFCHSFFVFLFLSIFFSFFFFFNFLSIFFSFYVFLFNFFCLLFYTVFFVIIIMNVLRLSWLCLFLVFLSLFVLGMFLLLLSSNCHSSRCTF